MNRRHGLFLAVAIGLAAIAGTYAALQTTDLGAQAATVSEQEIAAADLRLDKQEAALRRAAKKRPPMLPKPGRSRPTPAAARPTRACTRAETWPARGGPRSERTCAWSTGPPRRARRRPWHMRFSAASARTTSSPTSGPTSSACASSTWATPASPTTTEIDGDNDSFTVRYRDVEDRLVAALTANRPREVGTLRRELAGEADAEFAQVGAA